MADENSNEDGDEGILNVPEALTREEEPKSGEEDKATGQEWRVTYGDEEFTIPEPFRGDKPGEINALAAVKAAMDSRKAITGAPEEYKLAVPEELQDVVTFDPEDEFTQKAFEVGKKHGLTQDALSDLAALHFEMIGGAAKEEGEFFENQPDALYEAWGGKEKALERGEALINNLVGIMAADVKAGSLKEDAASAFLNEIGVLNMSASGLQLLDYLTGKLGEKPVGGGTDIDLAGTLSESDLKSLMASDAYQDKNHPEFAKTRAKVRSGFEALQKTA